MLIQELSDTLKKVEKEVGIETVLLKEKEVSSFCELIGDANPLYFSDESAKDAGFESKIIPPGYVMNLTNRVIQKIFIKIGPLFISKIKGLIHASSDVRFFKIMMLNKKYKIVIETENATEKSGAKGQYYSIVFKSSVLDENNELCAVDFHNFFFKL